MSDNSSTIGAIAELAARLEAAEAALAIVKRTPAYEAAEFRERQRVAAALAPAAYAAARAGDFGPLAALGAHDLAAVARGTHGSPLEIIEGAPDALREQMMALVGPSTKIELAVRAHERAGTVPQHEVITPARGSALSKAPRQITPEAAKTLVNINLGRFVVSDPRGFYAAEGLGWGVDEGATFIVPAGSASKLMDSDWGLADALRTGLAVVAPASAAENRRQLTLALASGLSYSPGAVLGHHCK